MPSLTDWHRLIWPAIIIFFLLSTFFTNQAAAQRVRGGPDLALRVLPPPDGCGVGQVCPLEVQIRNRGARPFVGALNFSQSIEPQRVVIEDSRSGGWTCRTRGSGGECTRPNGILRPQETSVVPVSFIVPRDVLPGRMLACAAIDWRAPGALGSRNRMIQAILARQGYRMDPPDGIVGPQTRAAIAQFQLRNRIRVTGLPDRRTMRALVGPWGIGDAVARNDRDCAKVRLSLREPLPPRPEDDQQPPQFDAPAPDEEPGQLDIPPPPGQPLLSCGPNEVASQSGCRCKPGFQVNLDGECIRRSEAAQQPPADQQETCTGGKFRSARGECVCPADKKDVDGVCKRPEKLRNSVTTPEPSLSQPKPDPEPEQAPLTDSKSCPGNQIIGKDGKCGCYLDMKTKDGKCLVKVRKDCLPGQIINIRGKCECPKGETVRGGRCEKQ